ncbi:aminoglycoside phosphotransferase family protein [Denitrobaculum tricleocarpae]|uniref:Phosphotransferase n=1 Tax=Denitrobaculum tricleocarpae TaxID=2591009 RepID=A0A545TG34_9PROT|nr:phosphotransferase [Denitrobaculum tricleocarpae]TQV76190.1 phosphotransferase [Denitrobaculum tricleocarpae]
MNQRDSQIEDFLARAGWQSARRQPLQGDASSRRYIRLNRDGDAAMLMDAPPPREKVAPFYDIGRLLDELGFSTPAFLAVDLERGFLLLEDFGDRTFTNELADGQDEGRLYRLAVDNLIALHQRWKPQTTGGPALVVPPYSDQILLEEVGRFAEWYLPEVLGAKKAAALEAEFMALWRAALPRARAVPDSLVLRDYHVDNLMVLPGREGLSACGLLDFQDAVIGPLTYDLMSLVCDVRRDVSPTVAQDAVARYLAAFPELPDAAFKESLAVMSAQRNVKILGNFTRLLIRDGKPTYLKYIPRTWRLIEEALGHPALQDLRAWFDETIPAERRIVPASHDAAGNGGHE